MMKPEVFLIVILAAPPDRFTVDIDSNVDPAETPSAEIAVTHPVCPTAATNTDVEDIGIEFYDAFAQREHPEVACVDQKVRLVVEYAIADADANTKMVGRQGAEFRIHQHRDQIADVRERPEYRIKGQLRGRRKQFAQRPVEAETGVRGSCFRGVSHVIQTAIRGNDFTIWLGSSP